MSACLLGLVVLDLRVNPLSGSLLVVSFGVGAKFAAGILCGWFGAQHNTHRLLPGEAGAGGRRLVGKSGGSIPGREQRLRVVLQNHAAHVLHSSVSLVLAVALLAAVRVEFIAA